MEKTYNPSEFEAQIYNAWLGKKYFSAEVDKNGTARLVHNLINFTAKEWFELLKWSFSTNNDNSLNQINIINNSNISNYDGRYNPDNLYNESFNKEPDEALTCNHNFMPVDTTGEVLACTKCGFVVQKR